MLYWMCKDELLMSLMMVMTVLCSEVCKTFVFLLLSFLHAIALPFLPSILLDVCNEVC